MVALSLASQYFQLVTLGLLLENVLANAALIIVVLFQHDIRRALARVGRGFLTDSRSFSMRRETISMSASSRSSSSRRAATGRRQRR